MSICIDARMLHSAGIGTYLKNIIPKLQKAFKVTVFLKKEDSGTIPHSTKIIEKYFNASIYSIKEQMFFFSKVPQCDIFFSPHFNVPFLPIRAKKKVVTIHDVYHLAHLNTLSFQEKLYAQWMYKRAAHSSDQVITDSVFSLNELLKYTKVPKKKVTVISCAVDVELFKPATDILLNQVIQNYKIDFPFFLYVGNQKPHKNLKNLILAFQKQDLEHHLVILGNKKNLKNAFSCETVIQDKFKHKIHVIEGVKDHELPVFYQMATALVFPSFYEGFGLPVLEAMAVGCPVIASKAASIPEVGGEAAMYFDPHDPSELSTKLKILSFNKDLQKNLIDKGKKQIQNFSWEKAAKEHIKLFEGLLS
ncbi:MAG: glycosyltransferase family 1 protein [Chlamydiota bacterium]|jgi:glycosyltransferase involved in cell wall biosynthesis